ncbi:ATP-dependent DNA helicase RecG [Knoellia flava TL1]|uniref:ATP-dependent DNA helicase RecG n=2 Tax=Knoellia flava TaxID=913969 RepID=A0A8H9KV23_9MICO|nr:ATP-dependent DNA helicase RecG [Knoellia flava]KGN35081.1 ATP-dependent DNA helicase RecG [Knoellia flava TL1]GGB85896.1 ATP-dependent DNA helicase RecG [Knoellia flava]
MYSESTPLSKVLGKREATKFRTARDITTVGDLLGYWPRRYQSPESNLAAATIGSYIVAVAEVKSATTRTMKARRGRMLQAVITDGTKDLEITFFSAHGHEGKLLPGTRALFAGKVSSFNNRLQLAHPGYSLLSDLDRGERRDLIPIYRAVGNLHTWTVTECVRMVLDLLDETPEAIPEQVLDRRDLMDRTSALRGIHTPESMKEVAAARRRMSYEEAFVLQVALAQRRARQSQESTLARVPRPGGLLDAFDARLPFELTSGQRDVGETLAAEMARDVPMHRLLQGEVGSGKTVVALRAMLTAVDSGGQAALLAPTEVLAAQHHRSITAMLGDLAEGGMLGGSEIGTRVTLLTGSMPTASRRKALLDIASGDAGIVIGTHALIQEHVSFQDLALVVVDEQHRFGVEQRDALRGKATHPPHVLVMTATPIPRTVAMTVFGDMETSTLSELPAGRAPITTHVVPEDRPGWLQRTWERVAEEVAQGRQAYVVCPRIGDDDEPDADTEIFDADPSRGVVADGDDGDDGDDGGPDDPTEEEAPPPRPLASVHRVHADLVANPALAGLRVEILHGRLAAEEKDAVMREFAAGDIDVLVSTTVIEVGVDVPNASIMVVMDADCFGVSQLHQLRGRVGRGGLPGLCLLVHPGVGEAPHERLDAVAATTDGFELSRIDLRQRREGDILGSSQHGVRSQLQFLHVLEDEELIEAAREDALEVVSEDADLSGHPRLAALVAARVDAEQAAYLERG